MKSPLRYTVDWYIRNYQADDYVHISQIKDEIERRIASAVDRTNAARDTELAEALNTERTKHRIECDGYLAEMCNMEKIVEDAKRIRADAEKMHYLVVERAKELVFVTAENKRDRTEIINTISASMGRLDKLVKAATDIDLEITTSERRDKELLRLK